LRRTGPRKEEDVGDDDERIFGPWWDEKKERTAILRERER